MEKNEDNGFGDRHNIISVVPAEFGDEVEDQEHEEYFVFIKNRVNPNSQYKIMKITYQIPAKWVAMKGSWDNWKEEIVLKRTVRKKDSSPQFYVTMKIAPGSYQFKFIVDGTWVVNPAYPIIKNHDQSENNLLNVPYYSTLACPNPTNLEEKNFLAWRREEGKWTECGRIHHTLQGHSMNIICDIVYIFGGMANNKFTNTLYTFDPKTNEFSVVEDQSGDIPPPRAFHQ